MECCCIRSWYDFFSQHISGFIAMNLLQLVRCDSCKKCLLALRNVPLLICTSKARLTPRPRCTLMCPHVQDHSYTDVAPNVQYCTLENLKVA